MGRKKYGNNNNNNNNNNNKQYDKQNEKKILMNNSLDYSNEKRQGFEEEKEEIKNFNQKRINKNKYDEGLNKPLIVEIDIRNTKYLKLYAHVNLYYYT